MCYITLPVVTELEAMFAHLRLINGGGGGGPS